MLTVSLLVLLVVLTPTVLLATNSNSDVQPQVPCYFIFGDSLMDNGNNNHLLTQAKANFPPYGIDFPDGPTGRFSNGRNTADVIAQLLGFKSFIPPFATAKGEEIINGVNYASGGAGIRDETGEHMGYRISLNNQIINHKITISQLSSLIGNGSLALTRRYINQCIYTIGMGNNDYINNYFVPKYYQTSLQYTPQEYADVLVEQYSRQLQELYENGARKLGIFSAGYSGCCPGMMADYGQNSCVDSVNNAVELFNTHLNTSLNDLRNRFLDAKFIFIDAPLVYPNDLNVTDKPCCEIAISPTGKGSCVPNQVPCSNRQNYVFWDDFHPTERVSVLDGSKAYETLSPLYTLEAISPITHKEIGYVSNV